MHSGLTTSTLVPGFDSMTDSLQPSSRPRLLVRAWHLRDADAGALKLFMTLLRSRLTAEWALVEDGPLDLLVVPVGVSDPDGVDAVRLPGLVRLGIAADADQAASAPAPVLVRPLQFEEFATLLLRLEPDLIATMAGRRVAPAPVVVPAPPPAPAPAPIPAPEPVAAPAPVAAPSPKPVAAPAVPPNAARKPEKSKKNERPVATRTADAAPAAELPAQAAHPALELSPGALVKLRRWPDAVQLQGRRGHHRLASQISASALERDDLLALSGLPEAEVDAFLQAMHRADLLEVLPPESAAAAAEPSAADPGAAEPVPGSLFGLIRRRLGIGH
jgi:hypothetical protein